MKKIILAAALLAAVSISGSVNAQNDEVRLLSKQLVNQDYGHGGVPYAIGVHNIQTMRANREHPELGDGFGWTYNHAAMIAYWNDTFYINYLSDPEGEHMPSSQTLLQSSKDGYNWTKPAVAFPPYRVPDGYTKPNFKEVAKDLDAVMHQRMGFYVSKKSNRLFTLGYYGICMNPKDKPLDGNGIGRVIREIKKDGSMGPIYFIRYNHDWNESNTRYPFYKSSKDKEFVAACDELLADPLTVQQWVEECDRNDVILPIKNEDLKAFCYYTLPDGKRKVALWKSGLYAFSDDNGKTWTDPKKVKNIITGTAKSWGEKTSDGMYAMVYNPTFFRYPMVVVTSKDGLNYDNMLNVHGETTQPRYSGFEKSFGPQYLRGIMPGNGVVPDKNMWLAYSVSKEDIWVMRVTVPVLGKAAEPINDDLTKYNNVSELTRWNVYSPLWAPVSIQKAPNGQNALKLSDWDRYDFAKVERFFPEAKQITIEYTVIPEQNNNGSLNIELQNDQNYPATRVFFDEDGMIKVKRNYKDNNVMPYKAGEKYTVKMVADVENQIVTVTVNDSKPVRSAFFGQVASLSKVVFRTGEVIRNLNVDIMAYDNFVLEGAGTPLEKSGFYVLSLNSK